jgi:hypothetical protein
MVGGGLKKVCRQINVQGAAQQMRAFRADDMLLGYLVSIPTVS